MNRDEKGHQFTNVLGQEIRSSITAIRGALDEWRARSPSTLDDLRHVIERQLRLLTLLSEDLLSDELSLGNDISFHSSTVFLKGILAATVENVRPLIENRTQRLNHSHIDESLAIHGDRDRLIQAFSKLLHNASKFTPIGGAIFVSVHTEGRYAIVGIRDTGQGISHNELDSIFESELTPDGCRSVDRDGFNVGLILVKAIIASHGGSIAAESNGSGLGSEFTIKLPLIGRFSNSVSQSIGSHGELSGSNDSQSKTTSEAYVK
ncbi:sensor histidine kinase [Pirellulaceae bacterium SH449]